MARTKRPNTACRRTGWRPGHKQGDAQMQGAPVKNVGLTTRPPLTLVVGQAGILEVHYEVDAETAFFDSRCAFRFMRYFWGFLVLTALAKHYKHERRSAVHLIFCPRWIGMSTAMYIGHRTTHNLYQPSNAVYRNTSLHARQCDYQRGGQWTKLSARRIGREFTAAKSGLHNRFCVTSESNKQRC